MKLLVANRGEIALRVLGAAADLGWPTVAVHSEDEPSAPHLAQADETRALAGSGPTAYLDVEKLVAVAREAEASALHPGYGFLSESPELAEACADAGIVFVGPSAELLGLFGDKGAALGLAERCGVPVLAGTRGRTSLEEARSRLGALEPGASLVLKAVRGGGGRGMRVVASSRELEAAWESCAREARLAFGDDALYVERFLPAARHLEVQVVGDGREVSQLGERECTLQRRYQKLVEMAPSPGLEPELRAALTEAALRMARELRYASLGTFEFLVCAETGAWFFLEANARLQVEHTVTEAVTGIDLVQTQLRIAEGASLEQLGLTQERIPAPRGHAIQARINLETIGEDGTVRPSSGVLRVYEPSSGVGIRVDSGARSGVATSPRFDSLLAKLVAWAPDGYPQALRRMRRALAHFRVEGVATNLGFLRALLAQPEVEAHRITNRFVDERARELAALAAELDPASGEGPVPSTDPGPDASQRAGVRLATDDPLAVLEHGRSGGQPVAALPEERPPESVAPQVPTPPGMRAVCAPLQGTVVACEVSVGDTVAPGQPLLVMEAMKMEHLVRAEQGGVVGGLAVAVGDAVREGAVLLFLEERAVEGRRFVDGEARIDPATIRPDLAEVRERHALGLDERRPEAVAKRRKIGRRTARENVADLCDEGSFVEYGPLVIAAQRRRRSLDDLIHNTPADGLVAGIGTVNAAHFGEEDARCAVLAYDYTVLAGTQGLQNHRKKDRLFEIAEQWRLPLVFFTEGGGGRPGDTDGTGAAGLDCWAFHYFGGLSGLVPLVGVNAGRCFAGNAAILGCCDVVIATRGSNIGMGGPAMIEGGGLGIFRPEEVGPIEVQAANGVVDVVVEDEDEAVAVAKRYLGYFQGTLAEWSCEDQRRLRHVIPENRLRVYPVREVIELLADRGSTLELRRDFGRGMVTALARIEGRPLGIVANDPAHLAGAIDSDGADKAARFLQLCDAFDLPVLFLCDTPGIMVGPEAEKTALVRHAARLFVTGASLRVPFFTIVLRKGYGLGAQAMAGGSFKAPLFTVAWPTGEFGGMGLEGAVKLGYRKELEAETDPARRKALFEEMVARMYAHGKAVSTASFFEIDDVIDPADSRRWILRALRAVPPSAPRSGKKRPCVDTW